MGLGQLQSGKGWSRHYLVPDGQQEAWKKIIAEDPSLQGVVQLGIASEQVDKAADRIKPKQDVTEVIIRASQTYQVAEEIATVKVVIIDSGKLAPSSQVKFLVDSGVKKTILSEEEWRKIKLGAGDNKPRLKRCKTKFTHYGTREYLPIMGRSKCRGQDPHHGLCRQGK